MQDRIIDRTSSGQLTRRSAFKSVAAGGLAIVAATTDSHTAIAQGEEAISIADIAASNKVAGLTYREADRTLMLRTVSRMRGSLKAIRAAEISDFTEPAFHFDPLIPGTKLPLVRSSTAPAYTKLKEVVYNGNIESVAFYTVLELAYLIHKRKITSTELTKMYLARLKKFGPRLNCVVNLTEELALRQAEQADKEIVSGKYRGPLHGIPWGAKDLLHATGYPTTYGAKPYEKQISKFDATVVDRLNKAGAVLVAKLSMGELAMGDTWFGGLTRNPWKPSTGSSGSSAGPGSATAAGLVAFAIGSETLGSIVSPSTVNGTTGLRPTYGRVPRTGAMALSWTMDKLGPMTRSVEDCAAVLSAIYGRDDIDLSVPNVPFHWDAGTKLSTLRIGYDKVAWQAIEKSEKRWPIYKAVRDTLEKMNIKLIPVELPKPSEAYGGLPGLIIDVEGAASFQKLNMSGNLDMLAQQREGSWPNTFRVGSTIPAADYINAMRLRSQLQVEMQTALSSVDCFVTIPFLSPNLQYTNLTGHPTLVTRCGMLDGNPQMIEFTGQLYREDAILLVANAYEHATEWHKQWPDTENIPTL